MTTAVKPRLTLGDLRREHQLTGRKFLVVEGDSDRRFLQEWLERERIDVKISVTPVDRVDTPDRELEARDLSRGNRDRVICLALMSHESDAHVRFVADRDAFDDSELKRATALLWTDYPAIESYALNIHTFSFLNRMHLKESLPPVQEVFDKIFPALSGLFQIRRMYKTLHKPNYRAGLPESGDFAGFDVWKTVNVDRAEFPTVRGSESCATADIRTVAYGHDIAPLLLTAYLEPLERRARVHGAADLEGRLMAALAAVHVVSSENLFMSIYQWASS